MSGPIRLLLADDHAMLRQALADRLGREPDFVVVDTAANGEQACAAALQHQPHIVVLDIEMEGLNSFEAARCIRARCACTQIVFLSGFWSDTHIEQALAAGAAGYVAKAEAPETLVRALRDVAAGRSYLSPSVRSRLIVGEQGLRLTRTRQPRGATLTAREREVLRYVAQGLSEKETAARLHVSLATVHNHCTRVMAKLDIHNRIDLARFAIREGLVEA
jgi:DNA-binding NarL/FixJ family response regulator